MRKGNAVAMSARVLLVSGSTRSGSTNTAVLRTVQGIAPDGVTTVLYEGLADLPAFNPDDEQAALPAAAADLRQQIAAADAVLFCTPEYAGTLPGSFKNLLDWTVGGMEIYHKPVGWINAAAVGRGLGATASLELVLGYVGADIVKPACVAMPVGRDMIDSDGVVSDRIVRNQLSDVWSAIMLHLESRRP